MWYVKATQRGLLAKKQSDFILTMWYVNIFMGLLSVASSVILY
ncbi:hypothetical protein AB4E40_18730 [Clostridioides difficile]|nr:hypothetical protein [Clostridioides difficile]